MCNIEASLLVFNVSISVWHITNERLQLLQIMELIGFVDNVALLPLKFAVDKYQKLLDSRQFRVQKLWE